MTKALEIILSRPRTILTMMVVMIGMGIISYITIPKEANPDIDVPVYSVLVTQQGISPEDSERLLVRPLETRMRGLDGLKELTTIAGNGFAFAIAEFTVDSDQDQVIADIREKVDQATPEMPQDADQPIVRETNFALQPTIIVTLSGQVPERTLFGLAKNLKDEIEAISSVREVNIGGNREEVLEVILDIAKLEAYDISQNDLLNVLAQNNQLIAAGTIDNGSGRFNLKVPGLIETAEDIYRIPVRQSGEAVVTLGDISTIKRTFKEASSFTRVNGDPAISLQVVKRIGTNIIENNDAVRETVSRFSKDWPETVKINYLLDASSFINEVQGSLQASIMTAISLVMVVVVAALGLRNGILVGLAIPVSFAVGFMILGIVGMTVNMMVLFGMVLTVGMLVDGAIVVTEYADRKLAEGLKPKDAYLRAAQLMFWPVISSTATTLAAFLPLLLWPGVPGQFMSYLPIMVIIVLSASLMTALIFLPVCGTMTIIMTEFIAKNAHILTAIFAAIPAFIIARQITQPIGEAVSIPASIAFAAIATFAIHSIMFVMHVGIAAAVGVAVHKIGKWTKTKRKQKKDVKQDEDPVTLMYTSQKPLVIKDVPGIMRLYLSITNAISKNIFGNVGVIIAIIAVAFFVFSLFGQNNKGVEFFVDEEPDIAIVLVTARGNLSATQVRDYVGEVEKILLDVRGIEDVVMSTYIGGGDFDPLGLVQNKPADTVGDFMIEMSDFCCRRRAVEIFAEIRKKVEDIPGLKVEVRKVEGGPPTGKDLRLEVKSSDYDAMVETVGRVRERFDSTEGIQDIEDGRPLPGIEWEINVDRKEAGRYNAGIPAVGAMIQLTADGVLIGKYRPNDSQDELDIRVRFPENQRSFDTLQDLRLRTPNGQVPLANFVTQKPVPSVGSFVRKDGLYAMDVQASLVEGYVEDGRAITPADKVAEIQEWVDGQQWNPAVQLKFRGSDEEERESGEFLGRAAVIALFLMFVILVTQFNSFYQTIITLTTVILAIIGVLIGLMVTGQKFSIIMTGTGVVALAGIVVNNAIVLIDTFNRLKSEGVSIHEAVLKTSAQRLRPILLTTITTICGLMPMAFQITMNFFERTIAYGGITSVWWVQLSTTVISGLAFSTFLTLLFIPSMLTMPTNIKNLFVKRQTKKSEKSDKKIKAAPQPAE